MFWKFSLTAANVGPRNTTKIKLGDLYYAWVQMLLQMGLLLRLGPNVITDGTFITLGSKSYYRWDLYYAWVHLLHLCLLHPIYTNPGNNMSGFRNDRFRVNGTWTEFENIRFRSSTRIRKSVMFIQNTHIWWALWKRCGFGERIIWFCVDGRPIG